MKAAYEYMKRLDVRFRRHPSARAVYAAFKRSLLTEEGEDPADAGWELNVPEATVLKGIAAAGFWGWADTKGKAIHYWARPGLPAWKLAYLLGHEAGHCSGKPIRRGHVAEEERADTYGAATAAVLRHLARGAP